ncbi:MAG: hypothetical protein FJX67_17915, partial [Alphaproteobacteria bacterium]|nr:hypothetical protein [Alphaproteobacteria bacterium]
MRASPLSPSRARETGGTTVVEFATKDGTAIAGSDYLAVASTITMSPGATMATVLVPIRLDDLPEETETFSLVLKGVQGGKIGDDTGIVTIRNVATGIVDDFSADRSTTGRLALGAETKGGIQSAQDADWFQTALAGGKTYEIELGTATTGGGTLQGGRLALFDAAGGFQGLSSLSGPTGEPLLTVTPEAGGTFFVEARGNGGLGSYALRLREMTDDYAGDATTTGVLAVGATRTGIIERPLDDDWFKVFLTGGRKYQFDLSGADSNGGTLPNPRLMMFNEAGSPTGQFSLGGGPGGDPRLVFTPQTSGTYFVEVTDTLTKIGTYTLTLRSCPEAWCKSAVSFVVSGGFGRDCQAATAGRLTMGSSLNGAIV